MRVETSLPLAASCLLLSLACSSESNSPGRSGGQAGGNGGSAGAAPSSGGVGGGGGQVTTTGGTTSGGLGGLGGGGASASGGAAGGGNGGSAGSAGAPTGGSGGNAGSGGGTSTATPSPGCGTAERPSGGKVYVAGESWLLFPESYDGDKPLPVLFGFHGCGMGNRGDGNRTEYSDLTDGTAFEDEYVRAIPLSADAGGCWNYNTDITRVKALYDELANDHCIDTSRVFATGHSSGAQFIVQLLIGSHSADAEHFKFKGVAPVAASAYGPIATQTPVMYIQNVFDEVRMSNGKDAVDTFVAGNSCESTSTPLTVQGAGCNSDGTSVDPGCIEYNGCDVRTVWCSHDDPAYSGTGHGVPCFTAEATDQFFKSLD
jgi:polyhydroxybutyrate depolymerase